MNKLDRYIFECVKKNKKPGGVKISNLKNEGFTREYTDTEIYCLAKKVKVKICGHCNKNTCHIKSFKNPEFSDYCSMECYKEVLSSRNKKNNALLNRKKSQALKESRVDVINEAIELYTNNPLLTAKEISDIVNLHSYIIVDELKSRNLLDVQRRTKIKKNQIRTEISAYSL